MLLNPLCKNGEFRNDCTESSNNSLTAVFNRSAIAIEARNLGVLRRVILRASEDERNEHGEATRHGKELMDYVLDICMSVVQERALRNAVSRARQHLHNAD